MKISYLCVFIAFCCAGLGRSTVDIDEQKLHDLARLHHAMRSGYKPVEEASEANARTNIVKASIRDTLKLLGVMAFPSGSTEKDKEITEAMLSALGDSIRFVKTERFRYRDYLKFIDFFADEMMGTEADMHHLAKLLVYSQIITTVLDDFKKPTPEELLVLSQKLDAIKTIVPINLMNIVKKDIANLNQENIDILVNTLPPNLKDMLIFENAVRTDSPLSKLKWDGQYHGHYDLEGQAERLRQWRKEADDQDKKLYLMVGRTNNEIPGIKVDNIMWVYVDRYAKIMNPVGERHLLWDMNMLDDPQFLPDALFDAVVLDWSTWKFLGGQSLIPYLDDFEQAQSFMRESAQKQENSVKGWARILKPDGFVSFEQPLEASQETIEVWEKTNNKYQLTQTKFIYPLHDQPKAADQTLDDWLVFLREVFNNIKKHEAISLALPKLYLQALFKTYFKISYNTLEEFSFKTESGEIIVPFTPLSNKIQNFQKDSKDYKNKRYFVHFPLKEKI